jgi:hypothetical protein
MAVAKPLALAGVGGRFAKVAIGLLTVLGVLLPVLVSTPAQADAAKGGSAADLFVTSPPAPILASPGKVASTTFTVGNLGHNGLEVRIIAGLVRLQDNGQTRFVEGSDPLFSGRISIVPDLLNLPARRERQVHISVNVPSGLTPNDYFLGFLVSPVINSSSVAVENDIGALVVLNVPGSRDRKLVAKLLGLAFLNLSFSDSASGIVRAKSVGRSTLQFSTTNEISGWPSVTPSYFTVQPLLLPPGLSRDIPVRVSSWLGLGWYTFHTTLVYNLTDQTTGDVTLSRTVIVLNPLWLLVIPASVLLSIWARRRRRKTRRPGLHRATRSSRVTRNIGHSLRS